MNDIENVLKNSLREDSEKHFQDFEDHNKDCFFKAFKNYFKDRDEFEALLNKLNNDDRRKLIRLGFFYYIITKEVVHAGVTLISIFSLMEATSTNNFKTFDQWLLSKINKGPDISFPITDQASLKTTILSSQKEYFKEYGSSEKVRSFINNYFCTKDKQQLIKGFDIKDKSISFDSLGSTKQIKILVDMLYNERNAFVHNGQLPQMSNRSGAMLGYFKIKGKDTYVSIEISINTIQEMFERAFINFFEEICV